MRVPGFAQVFPCWIGRLDERNLFGARPAFQFLFALNRPAYITESFKPYESIAVVASSESVVRFLFVLECPFHEIACDADVEGPASARHDVGEISAPVHDGTVRRCTGRVK
jgi:hypothetical protein